MFFKRKVETKIVTELVASPPLASIEPQKLAELEGKLAALDKVQAVIEFELDGRIITANDNFLRALGYSLEEIRGKHHSLFVEPTYAHSDQYRQFWQKLGHGEFDAGQYLRLGKGGREIWIEASYNPIKDAAGKPFKVVKFAIDVTAKVREAATNARLRAALDKASASVMVADEGNNIIYANDSATRLFAGAQEEFRRDLPNFDASRIVGSNIDMLPPHAGASAWRGVRPQGHLRQRHANRRPRHADLRESGGGLHGWPPRHGGRMVGPHPGGVVRGAGVAGG